MTTYAHLDDQELATEIANRLQMQRMNQDTLGHMQMELQQRLEARGAAELPHPKLVVRLEYPSPSYDVGKLRRLGELLPPDVIATACTPEHEVVSVVPEKWDARVFRNFGKRYGLDVAAVIADAQMPGGPAKLKITEKK